MLKAAAVSVTFDSWEEACVRGVTVLLEGVIHGVNNKGITSINIVLLVQFALRGKGCTQTYTTRPTNTHAAAASRPSTSPEKF